MKDMNRKQLQLSKFQWKNLIPNLNLARYQDSNIRPSATVDNIFTVNVNMAAEPEVLIPSLLQKIKLSIMSRNGLTKLAACKRLRPTSGDRRVPNIQDGGQ